jgi:hemoglobin-like flavoprotein
MTPQTIALVEESFEKVKPISVQAAALFYGKLFELDPSLRPLFKGDIVEQGRKLMATLAFAVAGLRKPDSILPSVRDLGRRHAGYGVKTEHYGTVATALLWTLGQGLGPAFTPEVEAAWTEVYTLVAGEMQAGVAEVRS